MIPPVTQVKQMDANAVFEPRDDELESDVEASADAIAAAPVQQSRHAIRQHAVVKLIFSKKVDFFKVRLME